MGVSDFVLAPAIFQSVARGEWRRWRDLRRDPLARWILFFATSVLLGFLVGRLRFGQLIWWALVNRALGLFVLISIYWLFASSAKTDVWFHLRCFVLAGSILNGAALGAAVLRYACDYGSIFFFGSTSIRLSGLMHNPNMYGGYLAAILSVQLVAVAFGKPLFGRLWADIVNVAALLLGCLLTISRGSWLAVLVVALVVPFVYQAAGRQSLLSRRLLAPAGVAICIATMFLLARTGGIRPAFQNGPPVRTSENTFEIYFPHGAPSLAEFLRVARDPSGASDRLAIARAALRLYAASPSTLVLGVGLGGFTETAPATSLQSPLIIHNSFLWALVELGPAGLLCLTGIFQAALRRLWASLGTRDDTSASAAALFVALISVLAWCLSNDGVYQRQLWFLLGLATEAAPLPKIRLTSVTSDAAGTS
jgi:O-antigen ligase